MTASDIDHCLFAQSMLSVQDELKGVEHFVVLVLLVKARLRNSLLSIATLMFVTPYKSLENDLDKYSRWAKMMTLCKDGLNIFQTLPIVAVKLGDDVALLVPFVCASMFVLREQLSEKKQELTPFSSLPTPFII